MTIHARHAILCAWCLKRGRRVPVGWSAVRGSHGICAECRRREWLEWERQCRADELAEDVRAMAEDNMRAFGEET